jgi:hypothetical protein
MRVGEARAIVRYPDRVAVDLGEDRVVYLKKKCEKALRERPEARQTLDLDEEPPPPQDPLVEAAEADPFTPTPKPAPRAWKTVPIGSSDDD